MEEILNKCPVCGSNLEYHSLYQFSKVYKILKSGKLSSRPKRDDECPMECGFISCMNPDCEFYTNCDLEVEMMGNITYIRKGKFIKSMKNPRRRLAGITSIA